MSYDELEYLRAARLARSPHSGSEGEALVQALGDRFMDMVEVPEGTEPDADSGYRCYIYGTTGANLILLRDESLISDSRAQPFQPWLAHTAIHRCAK